MIKAWLSTDAHFGKYNNNVEWQKIQFGYYYNFFLKRFSQWGSKDDIMIFSGDLFDNKVLLDASILAQVLDLFTVFAKEFKEVYIIIGNHDIYQKDVNYPNSLRSFYHLAPNLYVIDKEPMLIEKESKKILLVPWYYNKKEELEAINSYGVIDYVFGHFEVVGAKMSGKKCVHGRETQDFNHIRKQVFSGHFHLHQKLNHVMYLGSPYHLDKNDKNKQKYLNVLDIETGHVESYENNYSPRFISIDFEEAQTLSNSSLEKVFRNNFVDITYDEKYQNTNEVNKFTETLSEIGCRNVEPIFKKTENIVVDKENYLIDNPILTTDHTLFISQYLKEKGHSHKVANKIINDINQIIEGLNYAD